MDGELQAIKDQIKALLREEEERKVRRRREEEAGGDDKDDSPFVEEAGSSEEVRVRVEVGKRRKVARQGRFSGGVVGSGGGGSDVEEVIRQLRCLSEEDRERCMRTFAVQSDEEVSSLSDENSGGAAMHVAPPIGDSVLTPCG